MNDTTTRPPSEEPTASTELVTVDDLVDLAPELCPGPDDNTDVVPVTIAEIVGHAITFSKIMSDEGTEISKEEMDAYFERGPTYI